MTLPKPAYGEPCNQCGQCCIRYPCPMAQHIFKQKTGRCPALEEASGDRLVCGFVASPARWNPFRTAVHGVAKMREAALVLIGHGTGCDAIFVGERKNEAYLRSKREEAALDPFRLPSRRFMRAMATWFGMELP